MDIVVEEQSDIESEKSGTGGGSGSAIFTPMDTDSTGRDYDVAFVYSPQKENREIRARGNIIFSQQGLG